MQTGMMSESRFPASDGLRPPVGRQPFCWPLVCIQQLLWNLFLLSHLANHSHAPKNYFLPSSSNLNCSHARPTTVSLRIFLGRAAHRPLYIPDLPSSQLPGDLGSHSWFFSFFHLQPLLLMWKTHDHPHSLLCLATELLLWQTNKQTNKPVHTAWPSSLPFPSLFH